MSKKKDLNNRRLLAMSGGNPYGKVVDREAKQKDGVPSI